MALKNRSPVRLPSATKVFVFVEYFEERKRVIHSLQKNLTHFKLCMDDAGNLKIEFSVAHP